MKKIQEVTSLFFFSYGGNNDVGKILFNNETAILDFPKENEIGYGFVIRNNVDAIVSISTRVEFTVETTKELDCIVEFKTIDSCGQAEKETKFQLKEGLNKVVADVPKLNSQLKEVCLFIKRESNPNLVCNLTFLGANVF